MMAMQQGGAGEVAIAVREAAAWAARWRDVERAIAVAAESSAPADPADTNQVAVVTLFALVWAMRESRDFALSVVASNRDVDVIAAELVATFRRAKEAEIRRLTGRPFGVPCVSSTTWRPHGFGVFRRPRWTEVRSRGEA
jgi:hypothetical protein